MPDARTRTLAFALAFALVAGSVAAPERAYADHDGESDLPDEAVGAIFAALAGVGLVMVAPIPIIGNLAYIADEEKPTAFWRLTGYGVGVASLAVGTLLAIEDLGLRELGFVNLGVGAFTVGLTAWGHTFPGETRLAIVPAIYEADDSLAPGVSLQVLGF